MLERPPVAACRTVGFGGQCQLCLGDASRLSPLRDFRSRHLQLRLNISKTVLPRQTAGGSGRCICGNRKAVPTPEIAVTRDKALPGPQQRQQARRLFAVDEADLLESASKLIGSLHVIGKRLGANRQGGIGGIDGCTTPTHGCGRINGSFKIVTQRSPERCLVALFHGQLVNDRRPQILGIDVEELSQGLGFGIEPLRPPFRVGERRTRQFKRLAGTGMRGLRAHGGSFGSRQRGLCFCGGVGKGREIGVLRH